MSKQKIDMVSDLQKNWFSIQEKVMEIFSQGTLDIKQISDLQRYIDMQDKIARTLFNINKG